MIIFAFQKTKHIIMDTILEILKYTIPSLILFATVYFMMKYHYRNLYNIENAKLRNESSKTTLALRLQAYERMAMFCERISPENLIFRMKTSEMSVEELKTLMLLAIKQEHDHNMTQQIYISDKLWEIIELCQNQVMEIISLSADSAKDIESFSNNIFETLDKQNPIDKTLKAIRKEVEIYFS